VNHERIMPIVLPWFVWLGTGKEIWFVLQRVSAIRVSQNGEFPQLNNFRVSGGD